MMQIQRLQIVLFVARTSKKRTLYIHLSVDGKTMEQNKFFIIIICIVYPPGLLSTRELRVQPVNIPGWII